MVYPLYLDPSMSPYRSHFAVVFSNGWHYYDDTSNDIQVGDCTWSNCNGIGIGRSYLSFNTSAITHRASTAQIYSAKVEAYEIHAANGCAAQPVDLYSAGAIGSSTAWPGPASSRLAETASARGDNCASQPPGVAFTSSSLTNYVQGAANNDTSTLNFGLLAPDESNGYQWKRFASNTSGGAAAQLTVSYDFPPSTPFGLSVANPVACPGKPVYSRDTTPTLRAEATDNNPSPLNVGLNFSLWDALPTSVVHRYNTTSVPAASNTPASWATNTSGNTNDASPLGDDPYEFHASATSLSPDTGDQSSPWSSYYHFTIDHTPPSTPSIASFDYPANTWGAPQGTPGKITFASSSDTAGFSYSFDSSGGEPLPTDTTCAYTATTASGGQITASSGSATITVPPALPPAITPSTSKPSTTPTTSPPNPAATPSTSPPASPAKAPPNSKPKTSPPPNRPGKETPATTTATAYPSTAKAPPAPGPTTISNTSWAPAEPSTIRKASPTPSPPASTPTTPSAYKSACRTTSASWPTNSTTSRCKPTAPPSPPTPTARP